MTRTLALISLLAAGLVAATPALAQYAVPNIDPYPTTQSRPQGGWIPWDPSFNQPHYGLDRARGLGRCVEDLGYGRYEYCD
jgi:hypothetical protein